MQHIEARILSKRQNLSEKAADTGDNQSRYRLGYLYANGLGVKRDYKEAALLYKLAMDNGYDYAATNLALMYKNGQGVKRDYKEAVRLMKISESKGIPSGTHSLALMYAQGLGVKRNEKEAVRLFKIAAGKNNSDSMYSLAIRYDEGRGINRNRKKAASLVFRAMRLKSEYTLEIMTINSKRWSKPFRQELQRKMKQEGYYSGAIDGKFGPGTIAAMKKVAGK